jgi:hypothetical protein
MKTVSEHIDTLKQQPHHIRRQVAFGTAAGITGLVALVWLVGSVTTGVFAIQATSFAQSTGAEANSAASADTVPSTSQLAGAAAAVPSSNEANTPAHIEIVNTASASAPTSSPDTQTVIPF